MKKLKIFSFPDRNPEYLQPQIDSFNKYIKDENTELIVVNASKEHSQEIKNICEKNTIEMVSYGGPPNRNFKVYYVEQMNWFRDNIQKDIDDYILFIHSDMFFINKLNWRSLVAEKNLWINPQYRHNFSLFYMWDGVLLFNSEYVNNNDLRKYFIWDSAPGSDMGGRTADLFKNIDSNSYGIFEFWNIYNINGNVLDTHLNGNIRLTFDMDEKKLREAIPLGNKAFPYEDEQDNYNDYYVDKLMSIKENFTDVYNFPHPVYFDLIQIKGGDILESPILHLKSGSGYQSWYKPDYIKKKLDVLNDIINKENG